WLQQELMLPTSSHDWVSMLLLVNNDESSAFDQFFPLWGRFLHAWPSSTGHEVNPESFFDVKPGHLFDRLTRTRGSGSYYRSLTRLRAYLDGHATAYRIHHQIYPEEVDLVAFTEWLREKNKMRGQYRWERIILYWTQDEKQALTVFFDLLDE